MKINEKNISFWYGILSEYISTSKHQINHLLISRLRSLSLPDYENYLILLKKSVFDTEYSMNAFPLPNIKLVISWCYINDILSKKFLMKTRWQKRNNTVSILYFATLNICIFEGKPKKKKRKLNDLWTTHLLFVLNPEKEAVVAI